MSRSGNRFSNALLRGLRGIRYVWVMFGVALLMLVGLETCYRTQGALRYSIWAATAGEGAQHPYQHFPWYQGYLADEQATNRVHWQPYVYHRRFPYAGRYVTVDSLGLRRTVQTVRPARDTVQVFFFGGSTMYGVSQRDSNTIASVFASRLAARRDPQLTYEVTNFGQAGYVFTQEVIELMLQLRAGARPDVVVFYDGLNEVAAAVQNGVAGLPQNEANRGRDFDLGRAVYSPDGIGLRAIGKLVEAGLGGLRIFQRLSIAMARRGATAGPRDGLALKIASSYANTARAVEALARTYNFRVLYVWQPSLHYSLKPLTPFEVHLSGLLDGDPFQREQRSLHRVLPALVIGAMSDVAPGRVVDLSGLFASDPLPAYTDAVGHNTERAVPAIVDGFQPALFRLLEDRASTTRSSDRVGP